MHDVFISYSSKDAETAETVRSILDKNGIVCWMAPRNIPGGSNYTKEIPAAIRGCQVFVLVLSENAQNSHWVLKELDLAVNFGKVILPFMLEDCQLNDEFNFLLTGAQRYEVYLKKAEAMELLIKRIHAVICSNVHPSAVEPATEIPANTPATSIREEKETVFLGLIRCPACGSEQIKPRTKVGKYKGFQEWILNLWCILPCAVAFFVALILLGFSDGFLVSILTWVLGSVLGCLLVHRMTDKCVYRMRLRRHIHPYPYRCEKCDWVFLQKESDQTP